MPIKQEICPPTINNELQIALLNTLKISRQLNLKEVCTEAFLYGIMENEGLSAKLLKQGFNIFMFKRLLTDKLKVKATENQTIEPLFSGALEGLLALIIMDKNFCDSSLFLMKTIIKHNNTAAARLLKKEGIILSRFNELIYKPITN